jgi:exopolyphosphatase/guanosine-5'-triphosphate,3'-diphosphate pyrophosphatase
MRRAVIDLGTNTFNLLVGEKSGNTWKVCFKDRIGVALGRGGICEGIITPEAIARATNAIQQFIVQSKNQEVNCIRAIGTSAIRDAKNQGDLLAKIREECGIEVEVISGQTEADFILQGVSQFHAFSSAEVIMDIGGGSTEFIFINRKEVEQRFSANIGLIRMAEQAALSDPLKSEEILALEHWLDRHLGNQFMGSRSKTLIGASGTFETFYELIFQESYPERYEPRELPINKLMSCLDELVVSTEKWRQNNPHILPVRKQLSHLASLKTRWVIQRLGIEKVLVCAASLKEGVLFGDDNDWQHNSNLL